MMSLASDFGKYTGIQILLHKLLLLLAMLVMSWYFPTFSEFIFLKLELSSSEKFTSLRVLRQMYLYKYIWNNRFFWYSLTWQDLSFCAQQINNELSAGSLGYRVLSVLFSLLDKLSRFKKEDKMLLGLLFQVLQTNKLKCTLQNIAISGVERWGRRKLYR